MPELTSRLQMLDADPRSRTLKRTALVVLGPARARNAWQELREAGFSFAAINQLNGIKSHNPETTGCLILDGACQPLANEILEWCERSDAWRRVPKILLLPAESEFTNLLTVPANALEEHLRAVREASEADEPPPVMHAPKSSVMEAPRRSVTTIRVAGQSSSADAVSDRRRHYRHPCNQEIRIEQNARMVDLSAGGVALEMAHPLPVGTRICLLMSENEPLLHAVDAQVIGCYRKSDSGHRLHLLFMNVTSSIERALHRHLLSLQTQRRGHMA